VPYVSSFDGENSRILSHAGSRMPFGVELNESQNTDVVTWLVRVYCSVASAQRVTAAGFR